MLANKHRTIEGEVLAGKRSVKWLRYEGNEEKRERKYMLFNRELTRKHKALSPPIDKYSLYRDPH